MKRLLRSPLLHFLMLGILAHALIPEPRPHVRIGAAELDAVVAEWERTAGRPAGAAERSALLEDALDEALLFEEARSAGMLENDPVVRRRLAKIGAFVDPALAEGDEEAAVSGALALGLEQGDVVVRRYATSMMRLAIEGQADASNPSDAELAAALASHSDRYVIPETFTLEHVFVSRSRGDDEARASRLLQALRGQGPEAGAELGDAFARSRTLHGSRVEIERVLGTEFAVALDGEAVGRWQGPVPSAYGMHLVYLVERTPERLPGLDEIRGRLTEEILRERRDAWLRRRLHQLRDIYAIELPTS